MIELGYVDIHSHVLYGLDDGAKTREQSVQMLRLAGAVRHHRHRRDAARQRADTRSSPR